jgi:hypothetical protein
MATRVKAEPPASHRPTGTVTFAFTDTEGSTQRWDRDRAAIALALEEDEPTVAT